MSILEWDPPFFKMYQTKTIEPREIFKRWSDLWVQKTPQVSARFTSRFETLPETLPIVSALIAHTNGCLSLLPGGMINFGLLDVMADRLGAANIDIFLGLKDRLQLMHKLIQKEPNIQEALLTVKAPHNQNGPMAKMIRSDLGLGPEENISDLDAMRAIWISLLVPLRQLFDQGSCFGTSVNITQRSSADGIVQMIRDYAVLTQNDCLTIGQKGDAQGFCPSTLLQSQRVE